MSATDAAWLAGFFDGEGSLTRYLAGRGRKYYAHVLSIPNTHLGSLQRCSEISGGVNVPIRKKQKCRKPHHKDQWTWRVNSQRDVASICRQILPYLTVKREVVSQFLESWQDVTAAVV